jgi:uncharacterized GH25 family protein/ketosteroid isomerase-like protein
VHSVPTRKSGIVAGSVASLFILVTGVTLSAHDFWIVPNAFHVAGGAVVEVLGQTSVKFPTTLSAVTPERVAEARMIGATDDVRIADLSVSGKSLKLRQRPAKDGQQVIAVALVTRTSKAAPAGLKRYIALEGAPALAERYEREGAFGGTDSLEQKTTKYAKTLVEVGQRGARAFAKTAGHALEFVPLADPSTAKSGDVVSFRLLFRGAPLAGAHVHAGWAPAAALGDSSALPKDVKDQSLVTNDAGVVEVKIDHDGLWNVRTLHAAPASGSPMSWEVAFATMVFQAAAPGSHAHEATGEVALAASRHAQGQGDSAAAVAAVVKFHAALAAGDSASALALLANDVVILESGGIETREEYRSHHLPGDMAFARAVRSERSPLKAVVLGDVAWVTGTSTTTGEYRGRAVNSAGAELVILTRTAQGWRISAVHWSSRTRRPAGG